METYAVPLPNEPGDLFVCLAVTRDITERQRAEEALRRSGANHPSLVQGAPNGICRVSADGKLLYVNPALVEMLGYCSAAELLAGTLVHHVDPDPVGPTRILPEQPDRLFVV